MKSSGGEERGEEKGGRGNAIRAECFYLLLGRNVEYVELWLSLMQSFHACPH